MAEVKDENRHLAEMVEELTQRVGEEVQVREASQLTLKGNEGEMIDLRKNLKKREFELGEEKNVTSHLKEKIGELTTSNLGFEDELKESHEDNILLTSNIRERDEMISSLNSTIERLEGEVETTTRCRKSDQQSFLVRKGQVEEEVARVSEQLRLTMEEQEEEVERLNGQMRDERDNHMKEVGEVRAEVSHLHNLLREGTQEKSGLLRRLDAVTTENEIEKEGLRVRIAETEEEVAQKEKQRLQEVNDLMSQNEDLYERYVQRGGEAGDILADYQKQISDLKKEAQSTKDHLGEVSSDWLMVF